MEIINNKERVPLSIYQQRYENLNPREAAERTGIAFDLASSAFTPTVLSRTLNISWPNFAVLPAESDQGPDILYGAASSILMIRYLLEGTHKEPGGGYLSYRELPWGEVYDRNFQGRCIKRLAFGFGGKLEAFAAACEKLGGIRRDTGDMCYDLPFLPDITVRLILWAADDEFPPTSQFLFSDNTPSAFTAEDAAVMGDIIIGSLKELSK